MRGRRPKPTALLELEGNPGKRPLNRQEPKAEPGIPEMPKAMGRAAKREWRFIAPYLYGLGVLTKADGKALALYCDAYAMWELAGKALRKHGPIIEEDVFDFKTNQVIGKRYKANPASAAYAKFGALMKAALVEFGLTPASRSRLKVAPRPAEPEDPMEALLARKPSYFNMGEQAPAQA